MNFNRRNKAHWHKLPRCKTKISDSRIFAKIFCFTSFQQFIRFSLTDAFNGNKSFLGGVSDRDYGMQSALL